MALHLQDGGKAKPLKKASGAKKELDDDDKAFQARGACLPSPLELLPLAQTADRCVLAACCPLCAVMTAGWPTLSRTCCVTAGPFELPDSTLGTT